MARLRYELQANRTNILGEHAGQHIDSGSQEYTAPLIVQLTDRFYTWLLTHDPLAWKWGIELAVDSLFDTAKRWLRRCYKQRKTGAGAYRLVELLPITWPERKTGARACSTDMPCGVGLRLLSWYQLVGESGFAGRRDPQTTGHTWYESRIFLVSWAEVMKY